eukprot:NODE_140_length_17926_cov_0.139620.p12 type:complete len:172 gc:universal NODE_140_length_17926_cov_0.139620:10568-11083(+)
MSNITTDNNAQPPKALPSFLPLPASNSENTVTTTTAANKDSEPNTSNTGNPNQQSNSPANKNNAQLATTPVLGSSPGVSPELKNNLPLVTNPSRPSDAVVKFADQVQNNDPSKTVEYFLSVVAEQTVVDNKTMDVYKTKTFAQIRPIYGVSASEGFLKMELILLLLLFGFF